MLIRLTLAYFCRITSSFLQAPPKTEALTFESASVDAKKMDVGISYSGGGKFNQMKEDGFREESMAK
jgi:hypothetical protein